MASAHAKTDAGDKIAALEKELEELRGRLATDDSSIELLQEQLAADRVLIAQLRGELEDKTGKINGLEEQLGKSRVEIKDLESQLSEDRASMADLKAALDDKEEAIVKLLDNNEKLRDDVKAVAAGEDKIANMQTKLTELQKQLAVGNVLSAHLEERLKN